MNTREDTLTLGKGVGINLFGRFIGRGLNLLVQAVIARFLGTTDFGLFSIGWTMVRYSENVGSLGLDQGVIRFAGVEDLQRQPKLNAISNSLVLAFCSGGFLAGSIYLLAPWIANTLFQKPDLVHVLRWISPALALTTGLQVSAAATRTSKQMHYAVISQEISQPLTHLILVVGAFMVGYALGGAIVAGIISIFIALSISITYVSRLYPGFLSIPKWDQSLVKTLFQFSIPVAFARIFATSIMMSDRLILGGLRPSDEVGVYQAAAIMASVFAVILTAFNTIFGPMIAEFHRRGDSDRLARIFQISTRWGIYVSVPYALVLLFASKELMITVFGGGFSQGWVPVRILAIGQFINICTGPIGILLTMTDQQTAWFRLTGLGAGIHIILTFLLTNSFGFTGTAIATAIGTAGLYITGLLLVRRRLKLWPYSRRLFKGLIATLVTGIILAIILPLISLTLHRLLLVVITSAVVFFGVLLILGLEDEDKAFLSRIWTTLTSKDHTS